jgi:hypothetical protein
MIETIFSSFWTFIGTVILLYACGEVIVAVIKSLKK